MAHSTHVDVLVDGFEPVEDFKIFNLEKFHILEDSVPLVDPYGKKTMIYTSYQRKNAG